MDKKTRQERRERYNRAVVAVWSASRRDRDLSQADLAKLLGVSRDTVAAIEASRREVKLADLLLFAEVIGEKPETILGRILRW